MLKGKTAIVIGSTDGIGIATALAASNRARRRAFRCKSAAMTCRKTGRLLDIAAPRP